MRSEEEIREKLEEIRKSLDSCDGTFEYGTQRIKKRMLEWVLNDD